MTDYQHKTRISWAPLVLGILLWGAATAMLLEESWRAARFDAVTLTTPILTAATAAAAVMAHLRFASWRLIGGTGFALLALLGSGVIISGTLGRTAEHQDAKVVNVSRVNSDYDRKAEELKAAKVERAKECRPIGPRCERWQTRVDALTAELSGITVRSTDPKADAIARLATLFGYDGGRTKQIVEAVDPVSLPTFLELASIAFFAASFHRRKVAIVAQPSIVAATVSIAQPVSDNCVQPFTREQALRDLQTLREAGSGRMLAERWGVDPATVSRWLQHFEAIGAIERQRNGRAKQLAAVSGAKRLTFQPRADMAHTEH